MNHRNFGIVKVIESETYVANGKHLPQGGQYLIAGKTVYFNIKERHNRWIAVDIEGDGVCFERYKELQWDQGSSRSQWANDDGHYIKEDQS